MRMQAEVPQESLIPAFLRDGRILQGFAQIIFVVLVVLVLNDLVTRIVTSLDATDQAPNVEFLQNRAGFDLADSGTYTPDDTYWEAFTVGVVNTLRVVVLGLVATTVIGILFGIFLLSNNFLVRTLARWYVEILRNTPILLQIIAWFVIVVFSLPALDQAIQIPIEGKWAIPVVDIGFSIVIFALIWFYTKGIRDSVRRMRARQAVGVVLFLNILFGGFSIADPMIVPMRPGFMLSIRGGVLFELVPSARFGAWMVFVALGIVLAGAMWVYFGKVTETTGKPIPRGRYVIASIVGFLLVGWFIVGLQPTPSEITVIDSETDEPVIMSYEDAFESGDLTIEQELEYTRQPVLYRPPALDDRARSVEHGIEFLPAYLAVFLGLVVYTSAFIAEIVRAGIQAVPKGQIEASRALGISQSEMLRLIILPQALRVILPPLGNQYLNFAKNSSLAIAVAYTDIFQVTTTIMNQSGQSVTGIIMVMISYLIISISISLIMNFVNQRFQLVTR